jgi:biotin transport system substrate-specific component
MNRVASPAENRNIHRVIVVLGGAAAISLLAQLVIPLQPVPITGQTFGVTLMALLLGRRLGFATVLTYLAIGAAGLPVFAGAQSGLTLGPTLGYLVGMAASAFVVGGLADRGYTSSFGRALVAGFCGSALVYTFGLIGLSFFVPREQLLAFGFLPFVPGDLIKTTLAASIAWQANRGIQ